MSEKTRERLRRLSKLTGRSTPELVEASLDHFESELRHRQIREEAEAVANDPVDLAETREILKLMDEIGAEEPPE